MISANAHTNTRFNLVTSDNFRRAPLTPQWIKICQNLSLFLASFKMLLISPALALGIHFSVDEGCPELTSHSMKEAAPRVSIPEAAERAAYLSDA